MKGWPKRNVRLAIRSILMDEMNNRGIKWSGNENKGLVDRLTEQVMGGTTSMRSNVIRVSAAAKGGSVG